MKMKTNAGRDTATEALTIAKEAMEVANTANALTHVHGSSIQLFANIDGKLIELNSKIVGRAIESVIEYNDVNSEYVKQYNSSGVDFLAMSKKDRKQVGASFFDMLHAELHYKNTVMKAI